MAGPHRRPEEVGEGREARTRDPSRQEAAGKPDRVDHRRSETLPGEALDLAVEKGEVEARVVRDEHRLACEGEKVPYRLGRTGSASEISVADPGQLRDDPRELNSRIDEGLESPGGNEAVEADRADLADRRGSGTEAGRFEVDDDVASALERKVRPRLDGEANASPPPFQPYISLDNVLQQAPGEPCRSVSKRIEEPRGLLGRDGASPLLDELDEPVGGIERELHRSRVDEHMFVFKKESVTTRAAIGGPRNDREKEGACSANRP